MLKSIIGKILSIIGRGLDKRQLHWNISKPMVRPSIAVDKKNSSKAQSLHKYRAKHDAKLMMIGIQHLLTQLKLWPCTTSLQMFQVFLFVGQHRNQWNFGKIIKIMFPNGKCLWFWHNNLSSTFHSYNWVAWFSYLNIMCIIYRNKGWLAPVFYSKLTLIPEQCCTVVLIRVGFSN